jgi:hypothetical protein
VHIKQNGGSWSASDMATRCAHVPVRHLSGPWDPLPLLTCPQRSLSRFRTLQKTNTSHPLRSSKDRGHELARLTRLQHHTRKACPTSLDRISPNQSPSLSSISYLVNTTLRLVVPGNLYDAASPHTASCSSCAILFARHGHGRSPPSWP